MYMRAAFYFKLIYCQSFLFSAMPGKYSTTLSYKEDEAPPAELPPVAKKPRLPIWIGTAPNLAVPG